MSDRTLLEDAARAAGFEWKWVGNDLCGVLYMLCIVNPKDEWRGWNPLTSDADALRLAVKLDLSLDIAGPIAKAFRHDIAGALEKGDDRCANARRAIVRAAAALGKGKE